MWHDRLLWPGVEVAACAARTEGGSVVGERMYAAVTPASVAKVQIALTALLAIDDGRLDGAARVDLTPQDRTPGPVGMSLFHDGCR